MFFLHNKQVIPEILHLATKPRIISLVPSITEVLADLELDKQVVGVTRFCIHPSSWRTKTKVGGTKNPDIESIRELKPDLVIANKEENEEKDVLEISTICPVVVTEVQTIEQGIEMIKYLAKICQRIDLGEQLINRIETSLYKVKNKFQGTVAYCIWKNPWMFAGKETFIHSTLEWYGFDNALVQENRYPEVSIDELIQLTPNYVFLSSEPFSFREKHRTALQQQLPNVKVILVDGEVFSWYGSRMEKIGPYAKKLQDLL